MELRARARTLVLAGALPTIVMACRRHAGLACTGPHVVPLGVPGATTTDTKRNHYAAKHVRGVMGRLCTHHSSRAKSCEVVIAIT